MEKDSAHRQPLSAEKILQWADHHFKSMGKWPNINSGPVLDAPGEKWSAISGALMDGHRGLPHGSSLARLLAERRSVPNKMDLPVLTHKQIVAWADAHQRATGNWPSCNSGPVRDAPGETWSRVDGALMHGYRGLPGGDSLARLLSRSRGLRLRSRLLPLRIPQILNWADAHFRRFREWPRPGSGRVVNVPHETWRNIDTALIYGCRTLPGGSSLTKLLVEHRGIRAPHHLPVLSTSQILAWADRHFARTGEWPTADSGAVVDSDETWQGISDALQRGNRGLRGRPSLATLLEAERGRPHARHRPPLTTKHIPKWADDHHERTGRWPNATSGKVLADETESWAAINSALINGLRSLRAGCSLPNLLGRKRGYLHTFNRAILSVSEVLSWADAHKRRTGNWPTRSSGLIPGTNNDTWLQIDAALKNGRRGLVGGSSLAMLLADRRGRRNAADLPRLTVTQILKWADAHKQRTGDWPRKTSGAIADAPGETWGGVQDALLRGGRGLRGGVTLALLLAEHRRFRHQGLLPRLTVSQITAWAEAYHKRTGAWPRLNSGEIAEAQLENWKKVDNALRHGLRGLPGASSLPRLLAEQCGAPDRKCHSIRRRRSATLSEPSTIA